MFRHRSNISNEQYNYYGQQNGMDLSLKKCEDPNRPILELI